MVFLCPTCNVQSSGSGGKAKPVALKKTGKGWREKAKQRSIMPTQSELGYTCPCCHELRSLEQYNPFKSKMASLFRSYSLKDAKKHSKVAPFHKNTIVGPEITTKSAEYLASAAGFSLATLASTEYRLYVGNDVTVSWDDMIEIRRHAMKTILMNLANKSATKIQTMVRIAYAKVRVRRLRDQPR